MPQQTVSEVLVDILAEAGVRHVFGIPGDAINALVDAIRRQDKVKFIQVRHEEAGAFAASAQAKLTGELAVCVGTAGPGAVHLLNGLYDARMDHAPVLAITGQVATEHVGTQYHQEVDSETLFRDVSVFSRTVMTPGQMPHLAVQAIQRALAHRAPAHLSIPLDVATQSVPDADNRAPVRTNRYQSVPCDEDLAAAAALLNDARRPVILAGIGCAGAREELLDVADRLAAPVVRSLRAKEVLPDDSPFAAGGLGQLGGKPAVEAMESADALLLAGTDFPYRSFLPGDVPAVQIDMEPTRIGRRYPVDVALAGHAAPTLRALAGRLEKKTDRSLLEATQVRMQTWFAEADRRESSMAKPIPPQRVARILSERAANDAIFLCDTGAVTVWGARHLRVRDGQRFQLSSALASMAFAMPAAIGAKLAYPDRQVIALAGDGGFSMLMADFMTAVKYELPITVVILNNEKLGLIQFEQEAQGLPEFETELQPVDYAAFARLCGGEGWRVEEPGDLDAAITDALASKRPSVVDVAVNPDAVPMPPKIMLDQAVGFSVAKIKELYGSLTGQN